MTIRKIVSRSIQDGAVDAADFTGTVAGNLTLSGTGARIIGDFSNSTPSNRAIVQTSTINSNTWLTTIPNGSAGTSGFQAYSSSSDPNNASYLELAISTGGGVSRIVSGNSGSGVKLPLTFQVGGSERVRIDTSGNVGVGTSSPSNKLDVGYYAVSPSTTANNGILRVQTYTSNELQIGGYSTDPYGIWIQTKQTNNSGSVFPLLLNPLGGNVGIGTNNPQGGLQLNAYGTFGNVYAYPAGNIFLHQPSVSNQHNWFGLSSVNAYASTSGSANLLLQASNWDINMQAGNYVGSEVQSNGQSHLTFGKLMGASTISGTANKVEFMRMDFNGNVGVGAAPSAQITYPLLQVGGQLGMWSAPGSNNFIYSNCYYGSGSVNKYIANGYAHRMYFSKSGGSVNIDGSDSGASDAGFTFTTLLSVTKNYSVALQGSPSYIGTGITFPATQYASSDANTLDDYEEGTWTPNIKSNGVNGNATGGVITGRYTKIGNVVNVWWQFSNCGTSGVANAGQQVCITGLPFAVSSVYAAGYGFSLGVMMTQQSYGNGGVQPQGGTTYMGLNDASLVNGVNIGTDAQYVKTSSIYNNGFATYIAA